MSDRDIAFAFPGDPLGGLDTEAFSVSEESDAELRRALDPRSSDHISQADVRSDVAAILWSIKLHNVRRYFHQRHWEKETLDADYGDKVEPLPKLESVSAHSWHIADMVLTIAPHFDFIDQSRCLEMAILHDKLELIMGDLSPIGRDGTGMKAHAFNPLARVKKDQRESEALALYLTKLRPSLRDRQAQLLQELQEGRSVEAGLVKALDKLQTLAFVRWKKDGEMTDAHLQFTVRYASRCLTHFPPIQKHYALMLGALIDSVAKKRHIAARDLYREFVENMQPSLL